MSVVCHELLRSTAPHLHTRCCVAGVMEWGQEKLSLTMLRDAFLGICLESQVIVTIVPVSATQRTYKNHCQNFMLFLSWTKFSSQIVVKPVQKVMISFILNEIAWNEVNMKIHYTWLVNPVSPWRHGMAPSLVSDVVTDDATHAGKYEKIYYPYNRLSRTVEQF